MTTKNIHSWKTEFVKLTDHAYTYIQEKGTTMLSNAGLIVGNTSAMIVDTLATGPITEDFKKQVKKVTKNEIKFLVITHHHGDHFLGNHVFSEAVSISHTNCRTNMIRDGLPDPGRLSAFNTALDFTGISCIPADITFNDTLVIHLDKKEVHLIHYGHGHTNGDVIVYYPDEGVVFCSDVLFYYVSPAGGEGLYSNWIKILDKVAALDANIFVPGHGPVTDRNGLFKMREFLMLLYSEAKKAFDAGIPYKEAALRLPLGEFKQWNEAERVLMNVFRLYQEFRNEPPGPRSAMAVPMQEMMELGKSGW